MSLEYHQLEPAIRALMTQEWISDINDSRVYLSPRLNEEGQSTWVELFSEAMEGHNDDWLETQLIERSLLNRDVPINATQLLSEGEFNHYYMRAICQHAQSQEQNTVEVYRARFSENPRPQSEAMIGQQLNAQTLLLDLRANRNGNYTLGVPGGINSGLSVRY